MTRAFRCKQCGYVVDFDSFPPSMRETYLRLEAKKLCVRCEQSPIGNGKPDTSAPHKGQNSLTDKARKAREDIIERDYEILKALDDDERL